MSVAEAREWREIVAWLGNERAPPDLIENAKQRARKLLERVTS